MLQTIRDRMSGPLVWGIIGFLVLLFAVWGIGVQSFIGGGGAPVLAKVGSTKITQATFQQAYNRSYQRLLQVMGSNFNPSQIDLSQLRQEVFDSQIRNALLEEYALRQGYRVPAKQLYDYLQTIPAFQDHGRFSAATYRRVLADNGMSPEEFEAHLRTGLRAGQLRNTVMGTSFVVPKEAAMNWSIQHQRRDFVSLVFDPGNYTSEVHVTEQQVRKYYESHKGDYVAPEKVKLQYVELNQGHMAPAQPPDMAILKAIYERQKDSRFRVPAEREASHILIRFGNDPSAAHKAIEAIASKLKRGASFAALAKKDSEDPGSKSKGGALGWIKRGMTDPAFQKGLFSLRKVGEVSAPVKTKFGWHLIKLDGIRPAHVLPFHNPDVQQQLIQTYDSQWASQHFQKDSQKLSELAFENPGSLEPVAKALDLKIRTTDWVSRKNPTGILTHHAVLETAFSKPVLENGENSKPIAVSPEDLLVIRLADKRPQNQLAFADVKDQIRKRLMEQAAASKAKAAARAMLAALRKGDPLQQAAKTADVKPSTLTGVTRQSKSINGAVIREAFGLPRPYSGVPSVGMTDLGGGRFAVISLTAVHQTKAPASAENNPGYASATSKLRDGLTTLEFDAYQQLMAEKIGVRVEHNPSGDVSGTSE